MDINNITNQLNNVKELGKKLANNEKLTPNDIQTAINIYRAVRVSPLGMQAANFIKNNPIAAPIRQQYKENVPINIRMAARGIEAGTPMVKVKPFTEKDMTKKELRQAYIVAEDSKKYPAIDKEQHKVMPSAFNYFNYSPENYAYWLDHWKKTPDDLLKRSFKDTNFALMTGVGSGNIVTSPKGDKFITDTYDFIDVGSPELGYGALHKLARTNTKPYDVNIKLPKYDTFKPLGYSEFMPQVNDYVPTRQEVYDYFKEKYTK